MHRHRYSVPIVDVYNLHFDASCRVFDWTVVDIMSHDHDHHHQHQHHHHAVPVIFLPLRRSGSKKYAVGAVRRGKTPHAIERETVPEFDVTGSAHCESEKFSVTGTATWRACRCGPLGVKYCSK